MRPCRVLFTPDFMGISGVLVHNPLMEVASLFQNISAKYYGQLSYVDHIRYFLYQTWWCKWSFPFNWYDPMFFAVHLYSQKRETISVCLVFWGKWKQNTIYLRYLLNSTGCCFPRTDRHYLGDPCSYSDLLFLDWVKRLELEKTVSAWHCGLPRK